MPKTKTNTKSSTQQQQKEDEVIPIDSFKNENIVFSDPQEQKVPGNDSLTFRRVWTNYNYDSGNYGSLLFQPGRYYCFGVQPDNVDKEGNIKKDDKGRDLPLTGYSVCIVLSSKKTENPTKEDKKRYKEEKKVIKFFESLENHISDWCVEHKTELGFKGKQSSDAFVQGAIKSLVFTKDDDPDYAPRIYLPLMYNRKNKNVMTKFYGPGDKEVNPLSMSGHFYITPTIVITNLYINNNKVSPQFKLYDATVEPIQVRKQKRLAPANTMKEAVNEDNDEEAGSDEEEGGQTLEASDSE